MLPTHINIISLDNIQSEVLKKYIFDPELGLNMWKLDDELILKPITGGGRGEDFFSDY